MDKTEGKKPTEEELGEIRADVVVGSKVLSESSHPVVVRMIKCLAKLLSHIAAVEGEVERLWSREERVFAEAVRFTDPTIKSKDLTIYGVKIRDVLQMKGRIKNLQTLLKEKDGEHDYQMRNAGMRVSELEDEIGKSNIAYEDMFMAMNERANERDALKQKVEEQGIILKEYEQDTPEYINKIADQKALIEKIQAVAKPLLNCLDKFEKEHRCAATGFIGAGPNYPVKVRYGMLEELKQACTEGKKPPCPDCGGVFHFVTCITCKDGTGEVER
jgi:hypothetical protein